MGFSRIRFFRGVLYAAVVVISGSSSRSASIDLTDRGAYLARVTGCVGCHTPRTRDGDVVESQLMSGGEHRIPSNLGAFFPPNITPDKETGLGDWRAEEIARAIRTGVTPEGRILSTAMPWRTQFKDLTEADALAIALYLKSLPPIRNAVPHSSPPGPPNQ